MRPAIGRKIRSRHLARAGSSPPGRANSPEQSALGGECREQRYRGTARVVGKELVRNAQSLGDVPFDQCACIAVGFRIFDRKRLTLEGFEGDLLSKQREFFQVVANARKIDFTAREFAAHAWFGTGTKCVQHLIDESTARFFVCRRVDAQRSATRLRAEWLRPLRTRRKQVHHDECVAVGHRFHDVEEIASRLGLERLRIGHHDDAPVGKKRHRLHRFARATGIGPLRSRNALEIEFAHIGRQQPFEEHLERALGQRTFGAFNDDEISDLGRLIDELVEFHEAKMLAFGRNSSAGIVS